MQITLEKNSKKPFAEALDDLFATTGLSMSEIGRRMELSFQRISQYRQNGMVSIETMVKLAAAFGVEPDYFLEYRIYRLQEAIKNRPELLEAFADVVQW